MAIGDFVRNSQVWKSIFRHPAPRDRRNRVVVMLTNVFLHLHPVSVRKSGIDLIKQAKSERPKLRVLVLSMHEATQYAVRAIKAGASGYVTKDSAGTQLVTAIRRVAGGGAFVTPEVAEQLALGAMPGAERPPHDLLSDREFEVFQRLVAGG